MEIEKKEVRVFTSLASFLLEEEFATVLLEAASPLLLQLAPIEMSARNVGCGVGKKECEEKEERATSTEVIPFNQLQLAAPIAIFPVVFSE